MFNGEYVGLFRCEDKRGIPDLYLGKSKDGANWTLETEPVAFYNPDGTRFTYPYAYDPRLIKIEDTYYTVFCADIEGPSIYIAKTKDFKHFEKVPTGFLPFNRNGVLFPEKINGMYYKLDRPYDYPSSCSGEIWISESPDLIHWGNFRPVLKQGYKFWNTVKIGPTPAIKTDKGWLTIFHTVDKNNLRRKNGWERTWKKRYCAGIMLLDLNDPSKIVGMSKLPLIAPETYYETQTGFRQHVIFPGGMILEDDGEVKIYYGAADTVECGATAKLEELIALCKEER
mgnify:CR=1 FL=1